MLGGDANAAVVLQQIHFWSEVHTDADGWFKASSEDLADLTGFKPSKCRHLVRKLLDLEFVEKAVEVTSGGYQKAAFRCLVDFGEPRLKASAGSDTPNASPQVNETAGSGTPTVETATPSSLRDINTPLSPPRGADNDGGGTLFGEVEQPKPARRRRNPRSLQAHNLDFDRFWSTYPRAARGPEQVGNQGDSAAARRHWDALVGHGVIAETLIRRASNYADARALATATWGGEAPLMSGRRFLDEAHPQWNEPAANSEDERLANWAWVCQKAGERATGGGMDADEAFRVAAAAYAEIARTRGPFIETLVNAGHSERLIASATATKAIFQSGSTATAEKAFKAAWAACKPSSPSQAA